MPASSAPYRRSIPASIPQFMKSEEKTPPTSLARLSILKLNTMPLMLYRASLIKEMTSCINSRTPFMTIEATSDGTMKMITATPRMKATSIPQKEGNTPSPITEKEMISKITAVVAYKSA